MRINPIFNSDGYKYSHWKQYPKDTEYVYSYIESRGGAYKQSVFFGIQAFVKEYLLTPFTQRDINVAAAVAKAQGKEFNLEGFQYVLDVHKGYWPVRIRAVPEGTVLDVSNVLVDVINTDPKCFWVTSFLETALLRAIWYPTTVATREYYLRQVIREYLEKTADPEAMAGLGFKLNDFGARGASSAETAYLGGLAHLISFQGTDNDLALAAGIELYDVALDQPIGFTVSAAEHSTMTSWGGRPGEIEAMRNMIVQFAKPGALVAVVSDSYDLMNAVDEYWGNALLEDVRSSGACIIVRPDSGDPVTTPVEVVERLMAKVGYTINSKGYKMLPPYFRVIQGDGVNEHTIPLILALLEERGLSTDNIAFGMGGAMLQQLDRDTMKFAMKCSSITVAGTDREVFKDPVTDHGKRSKKGRLELVRTGNVYKTVQHGQHVWEDNSYEALQIVYQNGRLYNETTFDEIRARAV